MGISLFLAGIGLALVFALAYPAQRLAERLGLVDVPGSAPHKQHARPTPLAGGMLMVAVFLILMLVYRHSLPREMLAVMISAFVIFAFGLWDDLRGLTAGPKLIGQLIASTILISFDIQVRFMTILFDFDSFSPALTRILNVLITLLWLVGITNAMNMIDSMDGIVAGLGMIASAFFMGAASLSGQPALAFWSACLLGISAGLYYWNGMAVRFFLGDSGAQMMGFLLACFGILYNPLNRDPQSS
ncbi:MAG: undecaprenyl/decaprenyl-phosphate alpha-N-acetylglucosaminyl 1-phosphate transferase [Chloroflexi bacterium]|nr:undecaprenyl/decaprenyl-phosphate alpha-N-acetylglucosaminyl 1-phosphate transferase [Chloroflexota bacterium]